MKKLFTLGLAVFTLTSAAANAQTTGEPKNLVTLTGNLDPAYSIEMSEADRAALAEGIQGINNMPSITVDVNSIYSDKDKPAFEAASKEVSRVLLEAAKKLVDMRAIVYKLDISLQQDPQHRFTENIYSAYNKKFQTSFTTLLQLFLGTDANFNSGLTNAMETCFTTSCLQDIASAQLDLIEFGRAINTRIDLNSSKMWEYKHGGFKSRLMKDAVRVTMDEVLKTNQEESAYVKMLRVAAAPFAAAAAGTSQAAENIDSFIHSQKAGRYLIAANPINKRSKEWGKAQEIFENRVGQNYELIVADNSGAKQYRDTPLSPKPILKAEPEKGTNEIKSLQIASEKLVSLNKIAPLSQTEATKILMNTISKFENVSDWVYTSMATQLKSLTDAGYSSRFPEAYISNSAQIRNIGYNTLNGVASTRCETKNLKCAFAVVDDTLHWVFTFSSTETDRKYMIDVSKPLNELIYIANNSEYAINTSPTSPKVERAVIETNMSLAFPLQSVTYRSSGGSLVIFGDEPITQSSGTVVLGGAWDGRTVQARFIPERNAISVNYNGNGWMLEWEITGKNTLKYTDTSDHSNGLFVKR